jgi:hypothetical protein
MQSVTYEQEFQVSQRVVLRNGDVFRATGGPYYVTVDSATGKRRKVSMAARGPFVFMRLASRRRRKWIEAFSKADGCFCVLAVTNRKSVAPGIIVPRPYRVTRKVRS